MILFVLLKFIQRDIPLRNRSGISLTFLYLVLDPELLGRMICGAAFQTPLDHTPLHRAYCS